MKKSITSKIERLLAIMTISPDQIYPTEEVKKIVHEPLPFTETAYTLGKFCRRIPITIANLIRPLRILEF